MDTEKLKKAVFAKRPVLQEVYEKFGSLSVFEYVQSWKLPAKNPDRVFMESVTEVYRRIYGAEKAEAVKSQLLKKPLVSTVDHLGVWGHPIFVNATSFFSMAFGKEELVPVLATESVSLNNITSWSGCVLFHKNDKLKRLSFFSDKHKTLPVFSAPQISFLNYEKVLRNTDLGFLPRYPDGKSFSEQACVLSMHIWQSVFPSAPCLVYAPLETIVLEYLVKVLDEKDNIFTKIISTDKGRRAWFRFFGDEKTFMFWGIDQKNRRVVLDKLPAPEELLVLVRQKKVYPSSPLCFCVLLYCGLVCAGGFTQTTWLTQTKEKFLSLLTELGEEDISDIKNQPTKLFSEGQILGSKAVSAYDLYLKGKDAYGEVLARAGTVCLKESIEGVLPEAYKVVVEEV